MAKTFDIKKFNRILNNYNQKIYALNVTGKVLILSNGLILTNVKDIRLCKRRVIDGDPIWKKNFDSLYDLDSNIRLNAEKIVKGKISRKGGINCQKKHGKN